MKEEKEKMKEKEEMDIYDDSFLLDTGIIDKIEKIKWYQGERLETNEERIEMLYEYWLKNYLQHHTTTIFVEGFIVAMVFMFVAIVLLGLMGV